MNRFNWKSAAVDESSNDTSSLHYYNIPQKGIQKWVKEDAWHLFLYLLKLYKLVKYSESPGSDDFTVFVVM